MRTFFNVKTKKSPRYATHINLLLQFIRRDIYSQYAGSVAGLLWTIITPLSQLLVYSFLFTVIFKVRLSRLEIGTDSFIVFFLSGLLSWTAFFDALVRSASVIIQNSNLVTKVAFPVELLPISTVASSFLLAGSGWILFLIWLIAKGCASFYWILLPLPVLFLFLFTLGLAWILSAISVYLRDMQQILNVVLNIWFYFTPILYPLSMVPQSMQWAIKLNPIYYFIDLIREILFKHTISMSTLLISFFLSLALFLIGFICFRHFRSGFADVL